MARPIAETPTLYGEDARRFTENMKQVEHLTPEERKKNSEDLHQQVEEGNKKWNLTFQL
ncbi:MAG: hypothetical protein LIO90_02210 [Bacteroidales bacterium]|nr:hypothetical protein [Bacteroidales bacterium]